MVVLEFQDDKEIIAEDRSTNIKSIGAGVLVVIFWENGKVIHPSWEQ